MCCFQTSCSLLDIVRVYLNDISAASLNLTLTHIKRIYRNKEHSVALFFLIAILLPIKLIFCTIDFLAQFLCQPDGISPKCGGVSKYIHICISLSTA